MKQTVIIKAINSKNIMLSGEYYDKETGQAVFLSMGGEVYSPELPATQKRFMHNLTMQNPELRYNFNWKEKDEAKSPVEKFKQQREERILAFWKKHPYVKVAGEIDKPFMALFSLEIVQDLHRRNYEQLKLKGTVYNIVNDCDLEAQRNICFMFGGNPTEMSDHELFVDLVDFNDGRLMIVDKPEDFLAKWDVNKNPDMEYIVNVKKAVTYGIISTKNDAYSIGNTIIGNSVDVVISYMKGNKETYEKFVKREVDKKELLLFKQEKKEAKDKADERFIPPAPNEEWAQKGVEKELRAKAKSMGIKSFHIKAVDTLLREIKELEAMDVPSKVNEDAPKQSAIQE